MKKTEGKNASIFELNGVPQLSKALPLALQHVVAMIVGCVTPAIIVAGVAGLEGANRVMLIQSALVVSALSTFLQLFPIGPKNGFRMGAGLPVIMGTSFAYVASMQAIAADTGIAAIFGAQIIGGIIAMIIGFFIDKIRKVFPPLVTGTVVFTIGLSLYPTAVNYMAGGAIQWKLRTLDKLAGSHYHVSYRYIFESFYQRIFETGFYSDRYYLWLYYCSMFRYGRSECGGAGKLFPDAADHAFWHSV